MDSYSHIIDKIEALKEKYPSLRTKPDYYVFSALCVQSHFYKNPENILCYGKTHKEMKGTCNIISCLYEAESVNTEKNFESSKKLFPNLLFDVEEIYGKRA